MDAVAIRSATRADLAAVDMLLARSYPALLKADYPPSVLVTALPLISRAQPALLSSGTYYLAERQGKVIGAGGWTPSRSGQGRANIRHVVTDHRHVRQGIGRTLFAYLFAQAEAVGITGFDCWATFTAVPFYHAMGFETVGPMEVTLADGVAFPAVAMRREVVVT